MMTEETDNKRGRTERAARKITDHLVKRGVIPYPEG